LTATAGAMAQSRDRIEPGIPVPSPESFGRSDAPSSNVNPGLRDDPNSPLGPALGTAGTAPDGSLNPSSGTMANPSQ
jgi:hypothetical protein